MKRTKLIRGGKLVANPLDGDGHDVNQLNAAQKGRLSDLVFKATTGGDIEQGDVKSIMAIRADAKVGEQNGMRKLQNAIKTYSDVFAG